MNFGNTTIYTLSLFWLIPAMLLFYIYAFKKKARLIELFCKKDLKAFIIPHYSTARQWFKAFLVMLGILTIIFALMRPRWGFHWEEIKRVGIDIIVAVDCSQSMMAEDVQPNRIERAKREIQDILNMLEGDRIGLVAFAGTSFVQCPLTLDYGAFRIFLDYLDTDLIPVQGTAITKAIQEAIGCFDRTQKGSKAIILITDGEDHEGDPLEAAKEAKNRGVKIFTIGIGKEGGAPIPEKDKSGFKKDKQGAVILTKLDEKTLQRIALETGGSYVRSVTGDLDLEKIYKEGIKGMEQKELASTKKRIWEERFQWFLLFAIIFLTIDMTFPERRRGLRVKKISQNALPFLLAFVLPAILLLCFIILRTPVPATGGILPSSKPKEGIKMYNTKDYDKALSTFLDAQIDSPDDPLLQYNIGNTCYRMGNYEEASRNYLSAANMAKDIELEEKAYYNLGNSAYRMGKLDEAVNWYMKALELKPDDEDAKHNLEFVRNEIKRRINENLEQQKKQENGGDEQQKTTDGQDGKQGTGQQQEQRQGKEGAGQEQQEQAGQEKNEQQQGEIREAGEGEKKEDSGSAEEKEEEKREAGNAQGYIQMSPEEAQRLLDSLDEDRKEALKKQTASRGGHMAPLKDW